MTIVQQECMARQTTLGVTLEQYCAGILSTDPGSGIIRQTSPPIATGSGDSDQGFPDRSPLPPVKDTTGASATVTPTTTTAPASSLNWWKILAIGAVIYLFIKK